MGVGHPLAHLSPLTICTLPTSPRFTVYCLLFIVCS